MPSFLLPSLLLLGAGPEPAPAPPALTFHLMQIQKVLVGVDGDPTAQAIQLRMRSPFQEVVRFGRLVAYDAAGQNPVLLLDVPDDVVNHDCGVKVLFATSSFLARTSPATVPDFVLARPIPSSYFAAGSLTWEDDFARVYWRLSWGGAAYTGSNLGTLDNDPDGDFGPPFGSPLMENCALQILRGCQAASRQNDVDYGFTPAGAPDFINNAGATFQLVVAGGTALRNGSGVNPVLLAGPTPPMIGGDWTTTVDVLAAGAEGSVLVLGFGGPTSGSFGAFGELLCLAPFRAAVSPTGTHVLPVPDTCALLGRSFCVQGGTFRTQPFRLSLTNALDVVVGTP